MRSVYIVYIIIGIYTTTTIPGPRIVCKHCRAAARIATLIVGILCVHSSYILRRK